jgi:hypothetical protein
MKFISIKPLAKITRTVSNSSTHSVHDFKKSNVVQASEARRRVRFNDDDNKYYANTQITKDQCRKTWYSGSEMKEFKTEVAQLARDIMKSEKHNEDPKVWSRSVLESYALFCQAESVADVMNIMDDHFIVIPYSLVGMEKWVLRPIVQDRLARRKDLQEKVYDCQYISKPSALDKALRKASRKISAPGRLYAHHVAQMAAMAA